MPPKKCTCPKTTTTKKSERSSRRPRGLRLLPARGRLVSKVQPGMLQAPVKMEVEKITKATQYEEPRKTMEVQTEPQPTVGLQAEVRKALTEPKKTGEIEIQTDMSMAGGKELYARSPRKPAEKAAKSTEGKTQTSIKSFLG